MSRIVVIGLAVIVLAFLSSFGCRKKTLPKTPSALANNDSADATTPRSTDSTPKSDSVSKPHYVGSETCQACHEDISQEFAKHAMGRSAMGLSDDQPFAAASNSQFEADGFRYEMILQGGNWVHRQERPAADPSTSVELPVSHVIGSGKNGQSFLVDRGDGYLFMSPMTWYPAKGIWDLSPGYETNNSQFHRPVVEECLFCHTDGASVVAQSMNRYQEPIVRAHAIGCERCHGPGSEHLTAMEQGTADDTKQRIHIVNPAKLSPELREAVCQQCHLSGAVRILKPHRQIHDFRPGESLHDTVSTFTLTGDGKTFVGHVEQMHASRCFQASDGQLGCISCHDPHSLPSASEKVQFYRARCVACHDPSAEHDSGAQQVACSLALDQRRQQVADDNCVTCHMPRLGTEVQHAAVTDHTVPKLPREPSFANPSASTSTRVGAFPDPTAASARERSLALLNLSADHPQLLGDAARVSVVRNLESIRKRDPQDLAVAEGLAVAYLGSGRVEEAVRICQEILEAEPNNESALRLLCTTYTRTGQHNQAAQAWERLLGLNPWLASDWYSLGRVYASQSRWSRCQQLAEEGKMRFPTSMGLRHLLVECHLQLGDDASADREFKAMESFKPAKIESLRDWYENYPRKR